jgi:hypothetical protein
MMTQFVRYNTTTGAVTSHGSCDTRDLAAQAAAYPGEAALDIGTTPGAQVANIDVTKSPPLPVMKN